MTTYPSDEELGELLGQDEKPQSEIGVKMERRRQHLSRLEEKKLLKAYSVAYEAQEYSKARNIALYGQSRFGWDIDNLN